MAYDPSMPNDLKKRNMDVRPNLFARTGALPPPTASFSGVQSGTGVNDGTIAPTPAAVNAGPVRPGIIDASTGVRPPSPLDANQPLPAGVRLHSGTPGSNDAIYEGTGKYGERAFGNNQYNLRGDALDPTSGIGRLASMRSAEIQGSVDTATKQANADAGAAAVAPKTAGEYTDRLKVLADIKNSANAAVDKHVADTLNAAGKAGENVSNDPYTQTSEGVRTAALKSGADPETALAHGQIAAAQQALDSGLDPANPSLPPAARAGNTAVRRGLASIINSRNEIGNTPLYRGGAVVDPDVVDPGEYDLGKNVVGQSILTGPASKTGVRNSALLTDEEANRFAPFISRGQRKKLISRR